MSFDRRLPCDKREEFKQPVGRDISESELSEIKSKHMMITVGDVVSLTVREHGIVPFLSIYDGYTERRESTGFANLVKREGLAETVVSNPAGMITSALVDAVKNILAGGSQGIIRVEGEEDLALLPCVFYAPEGAVVIYGWPGRGMKAVDTDGIAKKNVGRLLDMMEKLP